MLEGVVVYVAHPDVVRVAPLGDVEARGQVHATGEDRLDYLLFRTRRRRLDTVEVPGAADEGNERQKRKYYFLYLVHIHSFNDIMSYSVEDSYLSEYPGFCLITSETLRICVEIGKSFL